MQAVLLTIQIMITMMAGVIGKKFGIVGNDFRAKVSPFLLDICMPCLIVNSFAGLDFDPESFKSGIYLMLISVLVIFVLYLVGLAFKIISKDKTAGCVGTFLGDFLKFHIYGHTGCRGAIR